MTTGTDDLVAVLTRAHAQEIWDDMTRAERLHLRDAGVAPAPRIRRAEGFGYDGGRLVSALREFARTYAPPPAG